MNQHSFIDALLPPGIGRVAVLERIAALVDWRLIEGQVNKVRHAGTGRPPYAPLTMFKALLLAQWYGLSDPGLEEALLDRVSFRRFCGLTLDGGTPDETTLCRFRQTLRQVGLADHLFSQVLDQLAVAGFQLKPGTLADVTLVRAPNRTAPPETDGHNS
ncbi:MULTISPECIES: transposase [unclassified Azospirillum]|uniref:transposase n=1 Tax=unclassified Azospirillum TaxID=2630922 RepID=UPI000B71C8C0|nr:MULTISPECIES: transposase [unclassified Azospirillum]SNS24702.1 Transposase domain [Azospirillum sp. RU38E]SNS43168.1 Transposase domain [Azospirillum sp. RU37A]